MGLESETCWGVSFYQGLGQAHWPWEIQVFIDLGLETLMGLRTGVRKTVPHFSSVLGIFQGVYRARWAFATMLLEISVLKSPWGTASDIPVEEVVHPMLTDIQLMRSGNSPVFNNGQGVYTCTCQPATKDTGSFVT